MPFDEDALSRELKRRSGSAGDDADPRTHAIQYVPHGDAPHAAKDARLTVTLTCRRRLIAVGSTLGDKTLLMFQGEWVAQCLYDFLLNWSIGGESCPRSARREPSA